MRHLGLAAVCAASVGAILAVASCGARRAPPPSPRPAVQPPIPVKPPEADPTIPPSDVRTPPPLASAPPVHVVLTRVVAAGRARVVVKGDWRLVLHDGVTIRTGTGIDADLVLGKAGATLAGSLFPTDAELRPAIDGDLQIDTRSYVGTLRIERDRAAKLRVMNSLDLEAYVAQVVNSEIPASFPREAQRTQAVLARTYVLDSTARTAPDAPLVVTDVGSIDQEFAGLAAVAEHRRIGADAAQSTRGLVLVVGGSPITAYYHSTCGGVTSPGDAVFGEAGSSPALAGRITCPWCTTSKYFKWKATLAGADVVKAAGLTGALEAFAVVETTAGGRAVSFDVKAGGRSKRVPAAEFRLRVGASALRSVLLEEARVEDGQLVVHGRGWGHGVGLCQMGAKTLAEKGLKAEAILRIYYPAASPERRW